MKRCLQLAAAAACILAMPSAHAGWFSWVGDLSLKNTYAGVGMQIVKADFPGQLQRRIGGDPAVDPSTFFLNEPGIVTAPMLRLGWQPLTWMAVEGLWGTGIDEDQYSENPDGRVELDSILGVYLKPQYTVGSFKFFGMAGQTDFEFTVTEDGTPRPPLSDSGFAWGAGIELLISSQGRLAFEYMQHYEDRQDEVIGVGISFTYLFGGEGGGDDYY